MGAAALTGASPLDGAAALRGAEDLEGATGFALVLDLPLFLFTLLSSCSGSTSLTLLFCTLTLLPGGLL